MNYAYLIPLLPFLSAVVIFFFGRYLPLKGAIVGILGVFFSLVFSLNMLWKVLIGATVPFEIKITWFLNQEIGFLVDGLSSVMLVVVCIVSFLVQLYSLGYMHGDLRFKRYFAYMSFFTFSMLGLVLSNNFLETFIFWELVGLCSYLLIGFWFEKKSASDAGKKAFITTKIGDLGFYIGLLLIWVYFGNFNFIEISKNVSTTSPETITLISILIFCGAVGKSAQFPLHVWLPDAMEGPTPVSALIHAATMVAAGVYLVLRTYFFFSASPDALLVVAWLGTITAFLAASMALVCNDIKRVLAYSTVSQLGYMMMALGVGGYTAGMFHLTTHAFFKALLFLCAGSVIHSIGTNDIRQMGGLFDKMKITGITFLIAALSISGIWPFSGFYSKDEILLTIFQKNIPIYIIGTIIAGMTAFYIFRLYLITFTGKPRDLEKFEHSRESRWVMTVPLIILGILSFIGGKFLLAVRFNEIIFWSEISDRGTVFVGVVSSAVSLFGLWLAFLMYKYRVIIPEKVEDGFKPIYNILINKYYFDEIYDFIIVKTTLLISRVSFWFDSAIIDKIGVDGTGWLTLKISKIKGWFDDNVIDWSVNTVGLITQKTGSALRFIQTGLVQNYLLLISFGLGLIVIIKIFM